MGYNHKVQCEVCEEIFERFSDYVPKLKLCGKCAGIVGELTEGGGSYCMKNYLLVKDIPKEVIKKTRTTRKLDKI